MAANGGARWSPEDDAFVIANAGSGAHASIGATLGRTEGAVRARAERMAAASHAAGQPLAEAAAAFGLSPAEVAEHMRRAASRAATKAQAKAQAAEEADEARAADEAADKAADKPSDKAATEAPPAALVLTPSQRAAFEAVRRGDHVCITGAAGTGKSTLLRRLREWATETGRDMGVTAMTGCAALLVGGKTLHSFLGIGLAAEPAEALAEVTRYRFKAVAARLRALNALVIDEISMADATLLDKASLYLQILRGDRRPFGGVQMLFIGDFCQLPPVSRSAASAGCFGEERPAAARPAFAAAEWARAAPRVVVLTEAVRQRDDPAFAEMLARLRVGEVLAADVAALRATAGRAFPEGIRPTILYALNRDVDRVNREALAELLAGGAAPLNLAAVYAARSVKQERLAAWAKSCDIPEVLRAAVGAQVVVTANADPDSGVVNGTRAVIVGYRGGAAAAASGQDSVVLRLVSGAQYTLARSKAVFDAPGAASKGPTQATLGGPGGGYRRGKPEGQGGVSFVSYFPLKMAYALSVHKSQGMTLDALELDLGDSIFESGQAYTALSRARSLANVCVTDVRPASFRPPPAALQFYREAAKAAEAARAAEVAAVGVQEAA